MNENKPAIHKKIDSLQQVIMDWATNNLDLGEVDGSADDFYLQENLQQAVSKILMDNICEPVHIKFTPQENKALDNALEGIIPSVKGEA